MNKTVIVLFGAPGCGKGYLGDCIKQEIINKGIATAEEIKYLSTGDLLRAEVASGSELGKQLAETIGSGKLVPDDVVDVLVTRNFPGNEKVVFVDGYPRTKSQLEAFSRLLRDVRLVAIKRETPVELIIERVSKRRVCKNCKATHSVEDEKCPKCGGESIIRNDDAKIEKRIEEYRNNTENLWMSLWCDADVPFEIDGAAEAEGMAKYIVLTIFGD
ncbi:MAG: nucleoside monophosphate kinase [Alphaproteobacteria bacterium]|nr:nucleoside monophosphate kinase [Alphaproteobacteria bacterium]